MFSFAVINGSILYKAQLAELPRIVGISYALVYIYITPYSSQMRKDTLKINTFTLDINFLINFLRRPRARSALFRENAPSRKMRSSKLSRDECIRISCDRDL